MTAKWDNTKRLFKLRQWLVADALEEGNPLPHLPGDNYQLSCLERKCFPTSIFLPVLLNVLESVCLDIFRTSTLLLCPHCSLLWTKMTQFTWWSERTFWKRTKLSAQIPGWKQTSHSIARWKTEKQGLRDLQKSVIKDNLLDSQFCA